MAASAQATTVRPRPDPRTKVIHAAIGLIVVSCIGILMDLVGVAGNLLLISDPNATDEFRESMTLYGSYTAIHAACALPILIGAICMVRLKCYWCAVGACVLALVPFFGPCYVVAIPFGFWGLLALRDPEVRAAFAGTVREEASVEGAPR
jgi:hypothetical protein